MVAALVAAAVLATPGTIAFEVVGRLHAVSPDGSGHHLLRTGGDASWPAWSPGGRRLAFTSVDRRGIFVVNANGTGLRRVTRTTTLDVQPAWSPDGRRLAFARFVSGWRSEIFVVGVDGLGLRRVTRNRGQDLEPDWAPNGKRIAWAFTSTRERGAAPRIHTMNPNGTAKRSVTDGAAPRWSPNGRRFAYALAGDVWTSDVDGFDRVIVRRTPDSAETRPVWSPDGTRLAFLSTAGSPTEELRLFEVEAAGGEPALVSPLAPVGSASWR
jgi:Tol biopolymer transport system component